MNASSKPQAPPPGLTVIRLPAVRAKTGLATSSIYELVGAGGYPAPIPISDSRVGWVLQEIDDRIKQRMAQDLGAPTVGPVGSVADGEESPNTPHPVRLGGPCSACCHGPVVRGRLSPVDSENESPDRQGGGASTKTG